MGTAMRPWQKEDPASILQRKIDATFAGSEKKRLPGLCLELLTEQKKSWLDLRQGYASLRDVRERKVSCRGFSVRLQYNPGRIRNTLAEVGEENENERRCFLCLDCLPEGQRGLLYRREYLILCNPRPIFSTHFTISHFEHRRQDLTGHLSTFLQILTDFGSGWTVFYNGPRCGASAPNHLHFQVGPAGQMPIEKEIWDAKRLTFKKQVDGVLLHRVKDLGREVVLLEGDDPPAVEDVFKNFLDGLRRVLRTEEEPMMNLAGFHAERKWRLMIFPRRKHRPDAFFKEGAAQVLVSPGLIDMGGILVTPVEKDFKRLDATAVEGIYGEVSLEAKAVERAIDAMG